MPKIRYMEEIRGCRFPDIPFFIIISFLHSLIISLVHREERRQNEIL